MKGVSLDMSRTRKTLQKNTGSALLYVLILMTVTLVLVAGVISMSSSFGAGANTELAETQAYYSAKAVVDTVYYELTNTDDQFESILNTEFMTKDIVNLTNIQLPYTSMGETDTAYIRKLDDAGNYLISATVTRGDETRTVNLEFTGAKEVLEAEDEYFKGLDFNGKAIPSGAEYIFNLSVATEDSVLLRNPNTLAATDEALYTAISDGKALESISAGTLYTYEDGFNINFQTSSSRRSMYGTWTIGSEIYSMNGRVRSPTITNADLKGTIIGPDGTEYESTTNGNPEFSKAITKEQLDFFASTEKPVWVQNGIATIAANVSGSFSTISQWASSFTYTPEKPYKLLLGTMGSVVEFYRADEMLAAIEDDNPIKIIVTDGQTLDLSKTSYGTVVIESFDPHPKDGSLKTPKVAIYLGNNAKLILPSDSTVAVWGEPTSQIVINKKSPDDEVHLYGQIRVGKIVTSSENQTEPINYGYTPLVIDGYVIDKPDSDYVWTKTLYTEGEYREK